MAKKYIIARPNPINFHLSRSE